MHTTSMVTRIHYGQQPPPGQPVIFFTGPTRPNPTQTRHWHDKGISFLDRNLNRPVTVALPTNYNGQSGGDGKAQFNWEQDLILRPHTLTLVYLPRIAPGSYYELAQLLTLIAAGRISASQVALCIPEEATDVDIPRYAAERHGLTTYEFLDTALRWLITSNLLSRSSP